MNKNKDMKNKDFKLKCVFKTGDGDKPAEYIWDGNSMCRECFNELIELGEKYKKIK